MNCITFKSKPHFYHFAKPTVIYSLLVCFSILIFSKKLNAQQPNNDIRSLQTQINSTKSSSSRIPLLFNLGNLYNKQPSGANLALESYQQALSLSNNLNLTEWQSKCLLRIAQQYGNLEDFKNCRLTSIAIINYWLGKHNIKQAIASLDTLQSSFRWSHNKNAGIFNEALWCLQQERSLYYRSGDTVNAILCLKNQGDANLNIGNLILAETELQGALTKLKAIHYPNLRDTYFLLSALYHLKGSLNRELYYCIESVKEAEIKAPKDSANLAFLYCKLAGVYEELGMHDNALVYYIKVLSDNYFTDAYARYSLCHDISEIMLKQNKAREALNFLQSWEPKIKVQHSSDQSIFYNALGDCYIALKQNDLAEYYLLKMVNTAGYYSTLASTNDQDRFSDNMQVCAFYVSTKNYKKAGDYIKRMSAVPASSISALDLSKFQLLQFKVDSASGDYITAIKHFEVHKRLTDSIFNVNESKQVEDIQTKYETERKDKDILILTKQGQLQKASLRSAAFMRNVILGGLIMLAILLALSYNRYQLKQKSNLQLEAQQTVIANKNAKLEQLVYEKDHLLNEKEWLLKEIHHRVKNNLQIVISLLNTQSAYLENSEALGAIQESQHRMQSISLIHQKLYQSDNLSKIDMDEYIGELIDYLKESFGINPNVQILMEIEPISLDVVQAVPIGLILNEAITNAIKYAFTNTGGIINITLEECRNNELLLTIKDNGRGLPDNFNIGNCTSLGMSLITGLTRQLHGQLSIISNNGVMIKVVMPASLMVNQ